MTLAGQTRAEYMKKYRALQARKRRLNRAHTLDALKSAETALLEITTIGPMKIAKPTVAALTGVRRAIQVLEDNVKL